LTRRSKPPVPASLAPAACCDYEKWNFESCQ
jgi:hypothetical protein